MTTIGLGKQSLCQMAARNHSLSNQLVSPRLFDGESSAAGAVRRESLSRLLFEAAKTGWGGNTMRPF
ncbi:hypothetical protein MCEMSEM23_03085 [Rhabdaerophilaceae bacterium]